MAYVTLKNILPLLDKASYNILIKYYNQSKYLINGNKASSFQF